MKKVILSLTLLLLFTKVFSQDTTLPVLTKEAYLKKSRSQKSGAWAFLGISVASLLGAAATLEISFSGDQVDNTGSTILTVVSAGALATSISLFIASGRSRRKAADLSLHSERLLLPGHVISSSKTFTAAKLVIRLNSR